MERWKLIEGTKHKYMVSDRGRVKSFWGGHWKVLKPMLSVYGYVRAVLSMKTGRCKNWAVHRLVLEAFSGPPPLGYTGSHLNGNKVDNRIENLQWMTLKDNIALKIVHGTHQVGETHGRHRLTWQIVTNLRNERIASGMSEKALGIKYGIPASNVNQILNDKLWPTKYMPEALENLSPKE